MGGAKDTFYEVGCQRRRVFMISEEKKNLQILIRNYYMNNNVNKSDSDLV